MNVLFITAGHFPDGNAQIARIKCFAQSVIEHHGSATVLSIHPSGLGKPNSKTAIRQGRFNGIEFFNTVSPKRFYSKSLYKYILFIWSIFAAAFWYVKHAKTFDSLYFHQPRLTDSILILLLAKLFGIRSVVDQTELFSSHDSKRAKFEEYCVTKWATTINCISSPMYMHFKSMGLQQNITQISITVDLRRFEKCYRTDVTNTLGYIGTFAEKDDITTMLQGFKLALTSNNGLRFKLIGNSSNQNEIITLVEKLELSEHVDLIGSVNFEEIPEILSSCDLLVMNRTGSQFSQFGYPTKLGEYLATGRPVIMSESGGYSKDYEHLNQVIKYQADNVSSLSYAILWRYEHIEESIAIGKRGMEYAKENFDLPVQGTKFMDIVGGVCG